ncbi:MAG: hypothetical protein ACREGI_01245 [Candidatus Levyibacteriota bacterium]
MQNTYNIRDLIISILTVINFNDDKEKFAEDVVKLCYEETIAKLLKDLPKEKQEEISNALQSKTTSDDIQSALQAYFPNNVFQDTLTKTTQTVLLDYLSVLNRNIDEKMRQDVMACFTSFKSLSQPQAQNQELQAATDAVPAS